MLKQTKNEIEKVTKTITFDEYKNKYNPYKDVETLERIVHLIKVVTQNI